MVKAWWDTDAAPREGTVVTNSVRGRLSSLRPLEGGDPLSLHMAIASEEGWLFFPQATPHRLFLCPRNRKPWLLRNI